MNRAICHIPHPRSTDSLRTRLCYWLARGLLQRASVVQEIRDVLADWVQAVWELRNIGRSEAAIATHRQMNELVNLAQEQARLMAGVFRARDEYLCLRALDRKSLVLRRQPPPT